jgi:hypothetical protein
MSRVLTARVGWRSVALDGLIPTPIGVTDAHRDGRHG